MFKDKELQVVNDFRKEEGLEPIVNKLRTCLNCDTKFRSQGLRLCPKCQQLRRGCACAPDGTAIKLSSHRTKDGKVGARGRLSRDDE
jgi:hypothetical protein